MNRCGEVPCAAGKADVCPRRRECIVIVVVCRQEASLRLPVAG